MATHNVTLSNTIDMSVVAMVGSMGIAWDNMTITQSEVVTALSVILDNLTNNDTLTSSANITVTEEDTLSLSDAITVAFTYIFIENINIIEADPLATIVRLVALAEELTVSLDLSSTAVANVAIASALAMADSIMLGDPITENLNLTASFTDLLKMAETMLEAFTIASTVSPGSLRIFVTNEENISAADTTSSSAALTSMLEEGINFLLSFSDQENVYSGWVMNPENYAITNYTNHPFNSSAKFNNKYLFANSSGLYEMGGTRDESAYIEARIKTASLDFGTSNHKQVPDILLGVNNDGETVLKVVVDGQNTAYYQLQSSTTDLETQRIRVGKGLYGRYWQFLLVTHENSTFDLDSLEFFPISFGRKIR